MWQNETMSDAGNTCNKRGRLKIFFGYAAGTGKTWAMLEAGKTAREKGIGALTLEVRRGNTPAISLYKSWDFKEEAVRKRYYRDPTEDAILMWNRQLLGITT